MSGHSKWSTIKRKKESLDVKRGALFGKLIKEIYAAARAGGANQDTNFRLKVAILNAKSYNVPKDNIDKALKKSGDSAEANLVEVIYEASGPAGTSFIIECLTDNINRTVNEVRAALSRAGGNMAKVGAFNFLFDKRGVTKISSDEVPNFEVFFLELIDIGADDVEKNENEIIITSEVKNFHLIQKEIESRNLGILHAAIEYIPKSKISISKEHDEAIEKFIDKLESIDDVQNLYHNIA